MDVHTPRSLDEALRLKAELPGARFVQGGTDVLVELNFDRSRPPALINLNEVRELRGFARDDGTLVLGAGLTYAEAMAGAAGRRRCPRWPRRRGRSARRRSATAARSAATSAPPRRPATLCHRCSSRMPRCTSRACGASGACRSREFLVGVKQNALEPDEIVVSVRVRAEPARADVHEGRAAERDGDLGLLARPRRSTASGASSARPSARRRRPFGS